MEYISVLIQHHAGPTGDVLIANVVGTGVDVIATKSVL